jgi:outer membrane protein OmpA-like peptidoglycan-associated protein
MKKQLIFLTAFIFLFPVLTFAQVKIPVKKKVEKKTEKEANKAVDQAIDDTFNSIFGKKKKNKDAEQSQGENPNAEGIEAGASGTTNENLSAWTKFDFVPGDVVIFEDNLEGEVNGEFPSKWDLYRGNVEIAKYGEDNVINFPATENASIVPLMKEKGDYLPEKFTVEFDVYFSEFCTRYKVEFYDMVNQKEPSGRSFVTISPIDVHLEGYGGTNIEVPNQQYPFWKHISISFNTRALKVYYGEVRTSNIPRWKTEPTGLTIVSRQCHGNNQAMIRNIRIAEGSKDLYERFVTDGKIVTNGIRFDVNKATLKPESMGVINEIYKLMETHPEITFSVEGHTDSDGDDAMNQTLSEQRANAVMAKLVELGISKNRLTAKGFGEAMPITDNNTPEGKANNRRVEFVKIQSM